MNAADQAQVVQGWQHFAASASPNHGFSMRDEARNTERHGAGWLSAPLRSKTISFVSAGTLSREDPPQKEPSTAQTGEEVGDVPLQTPVPGLDLHPVEDPQTQELEPGLGEEWTSDTTDEEPGNPQKLKSSQDQEVTRIRSPSASSEGSDVVVFAGRERPDQHPRDETRKRPDVLHSQPPPPVETETVIMKTTDHPLKPRILGTHPEVKISQKSGNLHLRRRLQPSFQPSDDEEAIMQDYIDHLAVTDTSEPEKEQAFPMSHVAESDPTFIGANGKEREVQPSPTRRRVKKDEIDQAIDWSSGDLADFDALSTTDEEIMDVQQVLRKRERPTGLQYLVHAQGATASDAKWMLHQKLVSASAKDEIRIFEEMKELRLENVRDDSEDGSTTDEDDNEALDDLIENIESEDEENAQILRRTARMTDEEIARALAKQEELGLGGDEVMLFDGHMDRSDHDEFVREDVGVPFPNSKRGSKRMKATRPTRNSHVFPSAGVFADVLDQDPYGGFDVMDFDRPSLKPKRKGRKGDLPFELMPEDAELAEQLQNSWAKDREKKAARKREKADARAAMSDSASGNDSESIKSAIRGFLVDEDRETLSLPPMAPHIRAGLHRLAKALSLTSQSKGKGDSRYPTLTKTVRTHHYTTSSIWEIDALMDQRRFFPRDAWSHKQGSGKGRIKSNLSRRDGISGASYMDGDIVGASAPEIGAENKGRAMLEKMGWSSGMAIGAIGNKGSLEVIQHVVRKTKAGLG